MLEILTVGAIAVAILVAPFLILGLFWFFILLLIEKQFNKEEADKKWDGRP